MFLVKDMFRQTGGIVVQQIWHTPSVQGMKKEHRGYVTAVILAAALIMCVFGVMSGEAGIVFTKAANICMECIGLG